MVTYKPEKDNIYGIKCESHKHGNPTLYPDWEVSRFLVNTAYIVWVEWSGRIVVNLDRNPTKKKYAMMMGIFMTDENGDIV